MSIKNRIWNELFDAKKNDQYLSEYLRKVKQRKRWYKIALILIGVIGLVLNQLQINKIYSSLIFALIVITEVLKNMIPEWFPDEALIEKLPEYRMMYVQKFEKLDELWMKVSLDKLTEEEAFQEYFNIRKINSQLEAMDNSIWMPDDKNLMDKATNDTTIYAENHYGINCEPEPEI